MSDNLAPHVQSERRIIAARDAIVPVDSQGIPTRSASVYKYDDSGLLISATKGEGKDELIAQELRNEAARLLARSVALDKQVITP